MKGQQPSLIRAILKLSTKQLQLEALKKVFETLNVNLTQNILVAYMEACENENKKEERLTADIFDIVKLLKLGLYGRMCQKGVQIIEKFLKTTCDKENQVFIYLFIYLFIYFYIFISFNLFCF